MKNQLSSGVEVGAFIPTGNGALAHIRKFLPSFVDMS